MSSSAPDPDSQTPPDSPPPALPQPKPPRVVDSQELFAGAREIRIQHGAEVYRLMITKTGKLVLHK